MIAVWLFFQIGLAVYAQSDADADSKALQGKWHVLELQTSGNNAPKDALAKARLEFKGDEMTWNSGVAGGVLKSRIRLDPSKSPSEIDITILEGTGKGNTFPGIYSLRNGRLRLCYSHNKERPKEFETKTGQLRELITLERGKSEL
jgi:uncharacterized protein (TIGR03067 family)